MIQAIRQITGIDITEVTRKRNVVELKALYCWLMREQGNTYTSIAETLGMNHATILYHNKQYPYIRNNRDDLQELEQELIESNNKSIQYTKEDKEINKYIQTLREENKALKQQIKDIEDEFNENNAQIIKRLVPLLKVPQIHDKLEAFIIINEKAKYYPKFD